MILGSIITYNPDIDRLYENVSAIIHQVDTLIIFDNNSNNIDEIRLLKQSNMVLIENDENMGISYALNTVLEYAKKNQYDWFLTLDQDSVVAVDLIEQYKKYIDSEIAILTCIIKDRNNQIPMEIMTGNTEDVYECITSGSLCNTALIDKIGGFDNYIFIDLVDIDICYKLKKDNLKIKKINYQGMLHEIGHVSNVRILNRVITLYNEKPFRLYYISRNLIYEYKKYRDKRFLKLYMTVVIKSVLFEDTKLKRIKAILFGTNDGIHGIMGKSKRNI